MKWAGLVCGLLIAWVLFRMFGQRVDMPNDRDSFIYEIALNFREPGLCQKIARYAEGCEAGFARPGYQISYLQSDCYLYLAAALPDRSLCEKVRPLRRGFMDGSEITPEFCRLNRVSAGASADQQVVVATMRKLGYLDQEIRDFQYRGFVNNPVHAAYDRLRKDGQFAERIKAAPNFSEPSELTKGRPANDLEYLYDLFAVDSNDSAYCDKISPNSRAESPTHAIVSLRLECYHDVAFNTRDITTCGKLPTRNSLPPGPMDYGSRESCLHEIAVLGPSRFQKEPSEYPPTFSSFEKALREIGYNVTIPEPTWWDYEDFLRYLSHIDQTNAAARAEFPRRVTAMN
jgi:hypothetical protein